MYFSKDADSIPTFESPWIHRGWTPAAYQAPLSMGFSRQEYWSGGPLPSPYNGILFNNCCSVTQSYLTLCKPVDCSMLGVPVPHYLLELAQTQVH